MAKAGWAVEAVVGQATTVDVMAEAAGLAMVAGRRGCQNSSPTALRHNQHSPDTTHTRRTPSLRRRHRTRHQMQNRTHSGKCRHLAGQAASAVGRRGCQSSSPTASGRNHRSPDTRRMRRIPSPRRRHRRRRQLRSRTYSRRRRHRAGRANEVAMAAIAAVVRAVERAHTCTCSLRSCPASVGCSPRNPRTGNTR